MKIPDEYVLVTMQDPGTPSFLTWEKQCLGPQSVAEKLDYRSIIMPRKLLLKGTRELVFHNWEHTHDNIWGDPYQLRARQAIIRCEYYKLNYDYVRAVRYTFQDLSRYDEQTGQWKPLSASESWGNKGLLEDTEDGVLTNTLFLVDRHFKRLFEVKGDMADPQELDYGMFFNEIFADG